MREVCMMDYTSMGYGVGLDGEPVERNRLDYPYSYSTFVLWRSDLEVDVNKTTTVYSDRLYTWDWIKFNSCCKKIWGNESQCFDNRCSNDIERFLCMYLNKKVRLHMIAQGCNHSSGAPLWLFNYEDVA